ncbi:MAG: ATP-dependent metallopeptidase FtsH/Yme1/Tma family protein [Spirochaetaceae bacterium]|nr:ATP-dependent metallopeptidase FtsH/Yme1/Tma family protein [Spirochaetaceae bacterium]
MKNIFDNTKKGRFGSIFFVLMVLLFVLFMIFFQNYNNYSELKYSDFIYSVENGHIVDIVIFDGNHIYGKMTSANGSSKIDFHCVIPYEDDNLIPLLEKNGVSFSGERSKPSFWDKIFDFLPLLLMFILLISIFKQNAANGAKGMQFGKSRARFYDRNSVKTTFADVAGQEEAKEELAEIIDFLKDPEKYRNLGAKIPKGVLLVGPPGTGKTLLARAVAGESKVSFLHTSGSDFVEMFVGVGASRVRDLFEQGRRMAPAIIFIDEIDAVGRARGSGLGGGHDEREQTLNQLLVEMDGFESSTGVIILAATNRPDVLDNALLRPGRFDRQVTVSLPDIKEREAILGVHVKNIKVDDTVDLSKVARGTPGMSGADLSSLVNEATLFAARKNKTLVSGEEFDEARDKLLMGNARKTMVIPEKEREMTACHESGHALPYYFLKNAGPLHKVTIIPRGRALGLTVGLPLEDSYSHTKGWLMDQLVILYGGYAAESLMYGETTTGTQNDLHRATELAHRMVCEWGMSEKIGAITYGQEEQPIFMGKEIARHKDYSEHIAKEIDCAVREILENAKDKALTLLKEHKSDLEKLTAALLEKETLCDDEIRELLGYTKD